MRGTKRGRTPMRRGANWLVVRCGSSIRLRQ
jgi:hypothetical protein